VIPGISNGWRLKDMVWFTPILFTFAATACSLVGLFLVRRRTHYAALSKHNDVGAAVFQTVGTLFTVLLAFVVVIVWESMGNVREKAGQEAGILGELIRDAGFFPDPVRSELQDEFLEYARAVIDDEWPAMARNDSSDRVSNVLNRIFTSFSRIEPSTARETNIHAEMLQ
jgi:ABC-type sugar transport system permease subunit